jgi:hypothetical protein
MGNSSRTTNAKRQKERGRQEAQQKKAERASQRREAAKNRPVTPGEDPDIAGIIPGPQPPRDDGF